MPQDATTFADSVPDSRRRAVKAWVSKIKKDKSYWAKDFSRMKENMNFLSGIQWQGQKTIDDPEDRYTANITIQVVNEKEAVLYARNPTIVAKRRERLDFQVWDGKPESLQQAIMGMQQAYMAAQQGIPVAPNIQAMALVMDYMQGMAIRAQVEKVGKSLELAYKHYQDILSPPFKEQMKGVVRRTLTCSVAYVRQEFVREYESPPPSGTYDTIQDTLKRITSLATQIADGGISDESDPRMEQLRLCMETMQRAQTPAAQGQSFKECLTFLFPKSRAIIPDRKCTDLVGFVNCDYVAEEHMWKLSYVNSYFETNILPGTQSMNFFTESGQSIELKTDGTKAGAAETADEDPTVRVFEVYDKVTKTKFWLCDGWPDYLHEPEAVLPLTRAFFPWFSIVFNKVEVDEDTECTAIGPSDVQQMKHPQKEWNRTREALRETRQASAPRWGLKAGALSEDDVDRLRTCPPNGVIQLQGMQDGVKIGDILQPIPTQQIQPALYDSTPLMTDVQLTTGQAEANLGAPRGGKKETATAASISEQSRMSRSSSNVDDLDDLLSRLAENGAELLLYECQKSTIQRIVGPGAVWPETPEARADFAQQLYLEVQAASSGRPNQALEVSNFERLVPFLMQLAGPNPLVLTKLLQEGAKRLNDKLDVNDFIATLPVPNVSPQQPLFADSQAVQKQQAGSPHNSQTPGPNAQPQPASAPSPTSPMGMMPGAQPLPPQGQMRQ